MSNIVGIDHHQRRRKIAAALLFLLLLLLLLIWFRWPRSSPQPVLVARNFSALPEEVLKAGKYFPLPYEGKKLPGRPEEPMPIPKKVYDDVELSINSKPVQKEPIVLPAGSVVLIEGVICGQPALPRNTDIGGCVGIVQKSNNKRGWILHSTRGSHAHTSTVSRGKIKSLRCCTFDVENYKLPEEPGEYLLVVTSYAYIGPYDHPELIAAEYDLVIE